MMKSEIKRILSTAAVSALVALSCVSCGKKLPVNTLTLKTADGREVKIEAEMARTETQRNHGYMERKTIPEGTGMLFLFSSDQMLSFWMKNTPHPLSIAFIDSQGRIRDIFDMTPFSLATVNSTVNVRYALETAQGEFARLGITTGDTLVIDFDVKAE